VRRDLPGWLLGGATIAATAVAVEATRHTARADGSPIDPSGAWRSAWIAAVIAALALAGVAVLAARAGRIRLGVAVAVAVVVQVVPLAAPLLLSQDAYLYWAEARVITVHHHSPYDVTPSQYPSDPATVAMSREWRTEKEPYGPVWATVSAVPALAVGSSKRDAQLAYRALAVLGVLLTIALVGRRTRSAAAVALLGWSPVIALHYGGGGHSDALLTLALVAAVALGASLWGGAAWPFAVLFKAVPVVVLPLELARRRLRVPRSFWVGLVGSGVVLAAVFVAAYGTGWMTASAVAAHGTSPIGGVHFVKELTGLRHRYDVVIAGLVFVAVYLVLLRVAWRTGRAHLGFALAALCMCSSLLRPWYALWPLALAAFEEDGLSMAAAYALAGYVLFADALPPLL
jgi:alpha-1,6-mannosyltransferase